MRRGKEIPLYRTFIITKTRTGKTFEFSLEEVVEVVIQSLPPGVNL